MTYKVSILVAIYNVEKEFLIPCIESLLCQTYSNLEIILVDDGSTDGSGEIVDSYEDPRIIKIHTPNQGVTAARKTGWMNATGDYCLFVDGDDMLAPDAVEFFMEKVKVKEYDIITGWFKAIRNNKTFIVKPRFQEGEFTNVEYVKSSIRLISNLWTLWHAIFKRSIITEKAFDIDRKFCVGEDQLTLLGILNNTTSVLCTNHEFYFYVHRPTSTTKTTTRSFDYQHEYYRKRLSMADDKLKQSIYLHILQKLAYIHIHHAHKEEKSKRKNGLKSLLELKAGYENKLPFRVGMEFFIVKSRSLSYIYRTVGWPLMSMIKNLIRFGLKKEYEA